MRPVLPEIKNRGKTSFVFACWEKHRKPLGNEIERDGKGRQVKDIDRHRDVKAA